MSPATSEEWSARIILVKVVILGGGGEACETLGSRRAASRWQCAASRSVGGAERLEFAHIRAVVRVVVAAGGQPARCVAVRAAEHVALLCEFQGVDSRPNNRH